MTHEEIRHQLLDYCLDLLPPQETGFVEQHLATCRTCREAVLEERGLSLLVQSTINAATQPNTRRLRTLMPEPPQKRQLPWGRQGWQKQFAPIFIILMLLAGAFLTQQTLPSGNNLPGFVVTTYAATATSTNTPTATAVQKPLTFPTGKNVPLQEVKQAAIPEGSALSESPLITPEPAPAPIISIGQLTAQ